MIDHPVGEDALREAEERCQTQQALKSYFDNAADAVYVIDLATGGIHDCNASACVALGYTRDELLRLNSADIECGLDAGGVGRIHREMEHGRVETFEGLHRRKDGSVFPVEIRLSSLDAASSDYGVSVARDITARKRAEKELREREEQLRQAQKMEAVGQLAGGIAHDFNNLLAAILGYCDLLLENPEIADPAAREDLREIKRAGERATTLTRQILAFSRRQTLDPRVISLGDIVRDMAPLLRRTLGEDIRLVTRMEEGAGWVEADAHQIEQVIMNLALNARDAMPSGGRLSMEVADVELSDRFCRAHPGARPGSHVRLVVADTGEGMDEITRERIFEPFFTTKSRDKGTGLGMAMVYGTVKQSNGSVFVQSKPGKGTKVRIYLPRVAPPTGEEGPPEADHVDPVGSETILLVEDEASLRRFVSRVLEDLGYRVIPAETAAEALQLAKKTDGTIDLLLTDIVLPGGMNGDELARDLTALQPGLPVLYMSGYAHDAIVHDGRLDEGVNFLAKPFTSQALTVMVRTLLSEGGREEARLMKLGKESWVRSSPALRPPRFPRWLLLVEIVAAIVIIAAGVWTSIDQVRATRSERGGRSSRRRAAEDAADRRVARRAPGATPPSSRAAGRSRDLVARWLDSGARRTPRRSSRGSRPFACIRRREVRGLRGQRAFSIPTQNGRVLGHRKRWTGCRRR